GRGQHEVRKSHCDARMTRDERESGVASWLWRQMRERFLTIVNCAHQRLGMTRRFRLSDVIIERFEIIVRIVRQRAQPAERVGVEPAMRIALAKSLEF